MSIWFTKQCSYKCYLIYVRSNLHWWLCQSVNLLLIGEVDFNLNLKYLSFIKDPPSILIFFCMKFSWSFLFFKWTSFNFLSNSVLVLSNSRHFQQKLAFCRKNAHRGIFLDRKFLPEVWRWLTIKLEEWRGSSCNMPGDKNDLR